MVNAQPGGLCGCLLGMIGKAVASSTDHLHIICTVSNGNRFAEFGFAALDKLLVRVVCHLRPECVRLQVRQLPR